MIVSLTNDILNILALSLPKIYVKMLYKVLKIIEIFFLLFKIYGCSNFDLIVSMGCAVCQFIF